MEAEEGEDTTVQEGLHHEGEHADARIERREEGVALGLGVEGGGDGGRALVPAPHTRVHTRHSVRSAHAMQWRVRALCEPWDST